MKIAPFNPKLMKFLHVLATKPKVMNSIELTGSFESYDGSKPTDRTIRRWFNYLQKYCFDYYYYLKYENLGLFTFYALITSEKDLKKLLEGFPLHDYAAYFYDFKHLSDVLLVRFLVPRNRIKTLKQYLKNSLSKGLIKSYELYNFSTPTIIYSPFHKVINKHGHLNFLNITDDDYTYFIELLKSNMNNHSKISLSRHIKNNPFILPILLTQHREHWSSVKIWRDIKKRLGNDVWRYFKKVRKKTDSAGIWHVQKTLNQIYHKYRNELLQQVRVEYDPIVLENYMAKILFLDFENDTDLINFVRELAKKSLMSYVYPPIGNSKRCMIFNITGHQETHEIMTDLIGKYKTHKILWRSKKKFKVIWGRDLAKFKYENIFDPVKCDWT